MDERRGFYTTGGDGQVVFWPHTGNDPEGELIARFGGSSYALTFSPDRQSLLIAQNNHGLFRIRLSEGRAELLPLGPMVIHDLLVVGQNRLLVATANGELLTVDLHTWSVTGRQRIGTAALRTLALHPDGRQVAVGGSDHHIRIIDIGNNHEQDQPYRVDREWRAHQHSVFSLSFDRMGESLLSAGRDARIRRWRPKSGYAEDSVVNAHLFSIHQLALSPDGKHFLTCSMDKTIKVWSSESLKLLRVLDKSRHGGHNSSVNRLVWLDNLHFASAGDDRRVLLWQLTHEHPLQS